MLREWVWNPISAQIPPALLTIYKTMQISEENSTIQLNGDNRLSIWRKLDGLLPHILHPNKLYMDQQIKTVGQIT